MTFQRSLIASLGIHVLLFGSALAFAHYGHLIGNTTTITVTLIGADQIAGKIEQTASRSRNIQSRPPSDAVRDSEPLQKTDANETLHVVTASKAAASGTPENEGASDTKTIPQDTGGEPGSRPGVLSPDQWQLIQAALERAKTYPRIARERGIEGVVHVRLWMLHSGNVERVEITKSSGSKILDAASVRTVYRAGPLPYANGWIDVPIRYKILK